MTSPAENLRPPLRLPLDGSLNVDHLQELICYFDKIKNSLTDNLDVNGHLSGAVFSLNSSKMPIPSQDSAACVPCFVGCSGYGTVEPKIGGSGDVNQGSRDSNDWRKRIAQAEKLQRELGDVKRELDKFNKLDKEVASKYKDYAIGIDLNADPGEVDRLKGTFRLVEEMVQSLNRQVKASEEPFALTSEPSYLVLNKSECPDIRNRIGNSCDWKCHYNDLRGSFEKLEEDSKKCLMYFSVFPENAVLRKSLLKNWWIGEKLFDNNKEGRGKIDKVLKQLLEKGFIEPYLKKRRLAGFKVDPLVKFVLIKIAEGQGFSGFDTMGVPSVGISPTGQAFLVKRGEDYSRIAMAKEEKLLNPADLKTLFNVNDSYPDFKEEWFSKLRYLQVLSLGGLHGLLGQDILAEDENIKNHKSKGSQGKRGLFRQHIEVEDAQFLKGMRRMKQLKFLGLQGISRLMEIPESIGNLSALEILDLCACHNLESLPKGLAKLKNLMHLDVSECYLLDQIPKGVASLSKLEVLKGFLVGSSASDDSCTLADLKSLTKLRKLSIYTNNHKFPNDKDLEVLEGFTFLENLSIVWGAKALKISDEAHDSEKPSKDEAPEQVSKVGVRNDSGMADDSKPVKDSSSASIPTGKRDTGLDKIPEDGEIESTKQSTAPMRPQGLTDAMKNKSKSLKRILSGKDHEGSGRMRNPDNNKKPSDTSDSVDQTQEMQPDGTESIESGSPAGIRKLELQCYPGTELPGWVMKGKLKPQKKLYIGGGNMRSLGHGNPKWKISILRLKFLRDLEMDWTELKRSFPELVYLEKVRCPKVSFFPCDSTGVWWKRDVTEEELDRLGLPWSFLKRKAY